MKKTIILGLAILFAITTYAQHISITGKVVDDASQPVELATIQLLNASDSSMVRTALSSDQGRFVFQEVSKGSYFVEVGMVGFEKATSRLIVVDGQSTTVGLPDITLFANSTAIAEVAIVAQRPLIERRPDMMVVNVENSPLAAGNTAMDILERSPGVTVDKDDNISLMGKQGVIVMIDGKQTFLSADQLSTLLRSTDGNSIKSIELITTPSSKYDASGSAGMINIVMKKNRLAGTNGTLTLGGGYGWAHKSNASVSLNHKTGNVNLYGNYNYLNNASEQRLLIDRRVIGTTGFTDFSQDSDFLRHRRNNSYRAGMDYNTSERNVFGIQVNGYRSNNDDENLGNTLILPSGNDLPSILNMSSLFDLRVNSFSASVSNQFNIDSNGRKLEADVDISRYRNAGSADYNNTFTNPGGGIIGSPLLSRSDMPTAIDIQVAKMDYTHPLSSASKIETGVKFSRVNSDNDMRFEDLVDGDWQNDVNRTNHFIYDEQVAAAYASYSNQFGKLGVKAGLRSEYTISDGNSLTMQTRVQRDYLDFFPSVFLSYQLAKNHQTGLSYSKRITRPNYRNLNPFEYFIDQYTSERGNPYLQPEYSHNVDLSYTLMNKYHLSSGYNLTNEKITEVMFQDDEAMTTWVTRDNLAKEQVIYTNLNVPVKITKYWNSNTNLNGFYLHFQGQLGEDFLDQGQLSFQARSNHTFTITKTFSAETSFNYESPLTYSIYRIQEQWSLDAGLSKSFSERRATLKLSVTDIFDTRVQRLNTDYANLNLRLNQNNETRIVRLTFTYNFGNMKNATRRSERQSEEKSRI